MGRLHMDAPVLEESRRQLIHLGLVAYAKPIYQVLPLDNPAPAPQSPPRQRETRSSGDPKALGDILRQIMEPRA